ncbi:uncharacterized protein [Venturia canescens]|uniref:uncharacterized protein n=1 Tax=Venturia canescens TaxID=32260 RepID=UPI001C9BC58C|nr:uncharacterized protein LOC122409515 [Venturia canescens]
MYESLIRLKKNATEPFTFLNNILDEKQSNVHNPVKKAKPTEIDLQLATLTRRVQLNKSLLERTNERVKEINFLVECNMMAAARELNYDQKELGNVKVNNEEVTDNDTALNIACPGIKELKRTISVTKEMLTYVKKICNNEIEMEDLPEELLQHMSP